MRPHWILASCLGLALVALAGAPASAQSPIPEYSPQVEELLATTWLGGAAARPDAGESHEVLLKYLDENAHQDVEAAELERRVAEWKTLVRAHPTSRYARAGLARTYRALAGATGDRPALRRAAAAYARAAEIGRSHGRLRYTRELSELYAELGNRRRLDRTFGRLLSDAALARSERGHYYLTLLDYADGLAALGELEAAGPYFDEAIGLSPENDVEAIQRWTRRLTEAGRLAEALEVLETRYSADERIIQMMPAIQRRDLRQKLGLDTAEADAEFEIVRKRIEGTAGGFLLLDRGPEEAGEEAAFVPTAPFSHTVTADDCRANDYRTLFCDQYNVCFQVYVMNIAEVLWNEARGETLGAQTLVTWSVRNRALQNLKQLTTGGYCDVYIGGPAYRTSNTSWQNLPCHENLQYPTHCNLSKYYCFVVHGGTTKVGASHYQYNDAHVATQSLWDSGVVYRAWRSINGYHPDVSSNWVPPWLGSCLMTCSSEPGCYSGSPNFYDGSPNGPMEYRAYSYTAAAANDCKQVKGFTCSNSSPNNYFWNRLDHAPVGKLNGVSLTHATGWAADPDVPYAAIKVEIWVKGPKGGGGTYLGTTTANLSGGGSTYPGNHAFSYSLPTAYRTGTHTFYAYGLNASNGGAWAQLSNSPLTRW